MATTDFTSASAALKIKQLSHRPGQELHIATRRRHLHKPSRIKVLAGVWRSGAVATVLRYQVSPMQLTQLLHQATHDRKIDQRDRHLLQAKYSYFLPPPSSLDGQVRHPLSQIEYLHPRSQA